MPCHKRALGGVAATAVSESPPAQRTRGAEQRAPFVTFNNVIDKASNIDVVQKTELKSQLVAKNLSDNFLPHMTKSQLMKRLNVSSDVAMCIRDRIVSFQREGRIAKKVPIPTSDDYDAVVAAVRDAGSAFGSRQKAIDDHCRSTGVMCHSGTVTKKMTANVDRRPRGKLSQASIDTISNLMYVATCDTTCKTLDTLKRFARACALLEQFYGSQEEYLNRMRQPEDLTEQPRVRHINLGLAGPRIYRTSASLSQPPPLPPNNLSAVPAAPFSPLLTRGPIDAFSPHLLISDDSAPVDLSGTPATASHSTRSVSEAQCQTDPVYSLDADAAAGGDDDGDGDSSNSSSGNDSDDYGSSGSSDDDEAVDDDVDDDGYVSVAPPVGRDVSNFNFAWNGPLPGKSTLKLSMKWPRKRQLMMMMKVNGWKDMRAQWVDKHRRSGANPAMLRMYFHEKRVFMIRNGIESPDQELNGDECLFRGEITECLRSMKVIYCRGLTAMNADKHAYATKGAEADSFALVIFPVISRNKCVFLQIILKGNPNAKANSKLGRKQAQLAKDVIRALPAELAAVAYCNFTKTGYQTAESFKDASRALLVALHLQESPQLLLTWNTPMRDIPPLRRRYMFKVDGSRTHCLNDHQFLIEITSRNLVLFPYTPNATAFVQELDQLCLLIFKRIGRMIVKLELSAMSDKPDFRNRFVSLVWAQDVAHCYKLDLYAQESQENFAVSDEHHPSGHTGLSTYEISPDVCDIMKKISDRVHLAWGPVRLATMLGHAMGAALLNPTVLAASFDAVLEERVFRRPLVVRELNFAQHRATLIQHKTDALSALAATMSGNLVAPQAAPAGHLPALMREVSIPDEKWDMFCEHILHSSENHKEFRKACAIYGTFSQMYDESRKSADKIAAFQSMFTRAGNVADHAAAAEAESADAQARVVEAFGAWMEARADSLNTIVAKVCDSRTVLFANYVALLTAGLAAIPADNAAPRVIASFIPQLNRITKAGDKVSQELQLSSVAIQNLQQKVQTQKVSKFPHASFPAPLDATRVFDENSQQLLQDVAALQIELQQEIAREAGFAAVRQRAAAPSAPARGANRGRGRGGVAGRGRGGRGGARQVAVDVVEAAEQVAAAAPAAASSSEDEDVVLFHAQRLRERAEKEAAERDALQRSYAAVQDELDA
jgi:hypothetical protein